MAPLGSSDPPLASRHLQHHTAVCFKRRESGPSLSQQRSASSLSLTSLGGTQGASRDPCLCLQRYGDFLVFRGSQNTVLYSLVTGLGTENVTGVSLGNTSTSKSLVSNEKVIIRNHNLYFQELRQSSVTTQHGCPLS